MKILFVRLSSFGDVIHTVPSLCALRRALPGATIHWAISPRCSDLLTGHPDLDEVKIVENNVAGYKLAEIDLRRERYDAVIDFQGLLRSAALAWLTGSKWRIGYHPAQLRERWAKVFLNDYVEAQKRHVIDRNLELLHPVLQAGQSCISEKIEYRLMLPEIGSVAGMEERPIAINVGAGWPTKRYPAQCWGELARELQSSLGRSVVVFAGPGEEAIARVVIEMAPGARLMQTKTYRQMGALLARCALLASSESGPLHLAVAVGCPSVCVIGVTDPQRNGPHQAQSRVVLPRGLTGSRARFTYARRGNNPTASIPVAEVLEAVTSLLEETEKSRSARPAVQTA